MRGSKSKGLTYERKFGKTLERWQERGKLAGKIFSKHWIHFEDDNGPGWAQPDYFVVQPNIVLVFELKLTQNSGAWEQLNGLYGPLLEFLFKRPTQRIQTCKNLLRDDGSIITRLEDLACGSTFHWTR